MFKDLAGGAYSRLPGHLLDEVKCVVASYHIRDGVESEDGSFGSIKITQVELMDLVAHCLYEA